MITWENYEEYMVMHADGELTPAQEQELMSFLYEHPELQSELTAFTMTKMIPDAEETYTRKASLLRPEPIAAPAPAERPKVIALPVWRRYTVAAGVAALLFASSYSIYNSNFKEDGHTSPVAANNTRRSMNTMTENPILTKDGGDDDDPIIIQNNSQIQLPSKNFPTTEIQKRSITIHKNIPIHQDKLVSTTPVQHMQSTKDNPNKPAIAHTPAENTYAHTAIEHMPTANAKELRAEQKNIAPAVTNVPALAIQYREDDTEGETASSIIDMLPVSDTKKAGMKSLASDAAEQYGMVNSIRQEIANANVSLSLKNKKLTFSF